jgi:hypothetical protein
MYPHERPQHHHQPIRLRIDARQKVCNGSHESNLVQDNAIITLHLYNKECGSQSFAPYGQLHGSSPLAPIGSPPPMSLIVMLVLISSPSDLPIFLKKEYDIKLIIAPPSLSIREMGVPPRCPRMYNGFKWFSEFFSFWNIASRRPKLIYETSSSPIRE